MYKEKLRNHPLPEGYLSKKQIKGKVYYYLQARQGAKVVSQYVAPEHVEALQSLIEERRRYQEGIKRCEADQKKIRKVVGSNAIK